MYYFDFFSLQLSVLAVAKGAPRMAQSLFGVNLKKIDISIEFFFTIVFHKQFNTHDTWAYSKKTIKCIHIYSVTYIYILAFQPLFLNPGLWYLGEILCFPIKWLCWLTCFSWLYLFLSPSTVPCLEWCNEQCFHIVNLYLPRAVYIFDFKFLIK